MAMIKKLPKKKTPEEMSEEEKREWFEKLLESATRKHKPFKILRRPASP